MNIKSCLDEFNDVEFSLLKAQSEETLNVMSDHLDKFESIQEYSVKNIKEWNQSCNDMLSQDLKNLNVAFVGVDQTVCAFDNVVGTHLEGEEKMVGLIFRFTNHVGHGFKHCFRRTHKKYE